MQYKGLASNHVDNVFMTQPESSKIRKRTANKSIESARSNSTSLLETDMSMRGEEILNKDTNKIEDLGVSKQVKRMQLLIDDGANLKKLEDKKYKNEMDQHLAELPALKTQSERIFSKMNYDRSALLN